MEMAHVTDHDHTQDNSASAEAMQETTKTTNFTLFFDLPREIRDLVYLHFPGYAWVDLMQMPTLALQPCTSFVSHQMRKESLESFYSRKTYFLDLRGWKSPIYPKMWTPRMVCDRWLEAIGDENAGYLRSISFYSHNFTAHVKIENKQPGITLRFRAKAGFKVETVEGVSNKYTFQVAAQLAKERVEKVLAKISAERAGGPLKIDDIKLMCETFEMVQPFLCRRNSLGTGGAVLNENDTVLWPDAGVHCDRCDDCGYHRITRGND